LDCAAAFGAGVLNVASRRGPANGRNLAALAATGDILLFLDADVCVHSDTISRIRQRFEEDPELGAVFGSYDTEPQAPQLVSQFRNLLHCFIHQTSNQRASTFWCGCGAIRREIFLRSKGFDLSYSVPSVEDIELGMRLAQSGVRIALDPAIQVKHLKRWTLWSMVVTDIRHRGISWVQLILASKQMPNDLNLRVNSRVSVALTALVCVLLTMSCARVGGVDKSVWPQPLLAVAFALILALNFPFYRFLAVQRGFRLALAGVPLHLIYFLCCGTALVLGIAIHCWSQLASRLSQFRMGLARQLKHSTREGYRQARLSQRPSKGEDLMNFVGGPAPPPKMTNAPPLVRRPAR
jgi:cellulose synthase/poly-beta-1,6-N-acetylglucosamine synthase-like glycosyltransferase